MANFEIVLRAARQRRATSSRRRSWCPGSGSTTTRSTCSPTPAPTCRRSSTRSPTVSSGRRRVADARRLGRCDDARASSTSTRSPALDAALTRVHAGRGRRRRGQPAAYIAAADAGLQVRRQRRLLARVPRPRRVPRPPRRASSPAVAAARDALLRGARRRGRRLSSDTPVVRRRHRPHRVLPAPSRASTTPTTTSSRRPRCGVRSSAPSTTPRPRWCVDDRHRLHRRHLTISTADADGYFTLVGAGDGELQRHVQLLAALPDADGSLNYFETDSRTCRAGRATARILPDAHDRLRRHELRACRSRATSTRTTAGTATRSSRCSARRLDRQPQLGPRRAGHRTVHGRRSDRHARRLHAGRPATSPTRS